MATSERYAQPQQNVHVDLRFLMVFLSLCKTSSSMFCTFSLSLVLESCVLHHPLRFVLEQLPKPAVACRAVQSPQLVYQVLIVRVTLQLVNSRAGVLRTCEVLHSDTRREVRLVVVAEIVVQLP